MFTVKIYKTIWAEEPPEMGSFSDEVGFLPDHVHVGFALKLPFAPFTGLKIANETDNYSFTSGEIIEVRWQHDEQTFICSVKDENPFQEGSYEYTFQWLIDQAINESGWQRISTRK